VLDYEQREEAEELKGMYFPFFMVIVATKCGCTKLWKHETEREQSKYVMLADYMLNAFAIVVARTLCNGVVSRRSATRSSFRDLATTDNNRHIRSPFSTLFAVDYRLTYVVVAPDSPWKILWTVGVDQA
jgi:hypothetical protein